ncbi:MAG TPA: PH domain-containing protein [Ignavibacteriaceae bacterium]|nr:PH domain-containing protein [Ignavibacteriaceae bacterium]
MAYNSVPDQFVQVLDRDEKVFWIGKPKFVPFMMTGIPFLLVGIVWFAFDYFAFLKNIDLEDGVSGFVVPFFIMHLFPTWGSILNLIRLALVFNNTYYTYTNKRLMMRSGFWGTDFRAIDYDKISDIEVNVNPIENMFNVGSIMAYSGRNNSKGGRIYDRFIAIENPYHVFKMIKQISVDVKTDYNFPNALRPDNNPGYKTNYKPGE